MTIQDLIIEWDAITIERKEKALVALFEFLAKDIEGNEGLILDLLEFMSEHESNDYFGEEGFDL